MICRHCRDFAHQNVLFAGRTSQRGQSSCGCERLWTRVARFGAAGG